MADAHSTPPRQPVVRPGGVNLDGQFFDPDGRLLTLVGEVTPKKARAAFDAGALVVYEGCGCGGGHGCPVEWIGRESFAQAGKPRITGKYGSPTWIDLWRGDGSAVIFLHGDVAWGDAIP